VLRAQELGEKALADSNHRLPGSSRQTYRKRRAQTLGKNACGGIQTATGTQCSR